ncbi:hypothetical protein AWB77_04301 [Caballeronia fortuita]|uniref:Uncharacterized protein n=1 Tax=Caballeronia fortuita TaxID=1777138 RepID=A0A158CMT2_9BURK|nr:DUF6723 family protein [Caballeronia fortuita]SAK83580.1 hypothetical protein AWB77_04301 [Caballeronia fortuita]
MKPKAGRLPKLVLFANQKTMPTRGTSDTYFEVYASYRGTAGSGFYGTLKAIRKADSRLLFPFDGAEQIGPYSSKEDATNAAQTRGDALVAADIAYPER